jgi:membrane protease subunit HflC
MAEKNDSNMMFKHWPTLLLGLIVSIVFLLAIFTFQVKSTETVVVTTFGKISGVKDAGLHFCWPYPVQQIHRFDNRYHCFDGNTGKIEETNTADGQPVIAQIFVVYKVSDPQKLFRSLGGIPQAEDKLNSQMRTVKTGVLGKYKFDELVSTDPLKMKLDAIEQEMKKTIAPIVLEQYGIEVEYVGIKTLGLPEKNTENVFNRMKAERNVVAEQYRADGKREAQTMKNQADNNRKLKLAEAEAQAKRIKAEGDAKAATFYAVFKEEPDLAAFLRKLESMRKILPNKTTLILNTNYAPFDLLKLDQNLKAEENKEKKK